ncbi:MAG: nucleotidyltransferase domain-containing protein [Terrimicrobiaceae bacterium]|nr:nucleotidyltransferase domain-containing protein [Terrimicrobiaceae bacterium]
MTPKIRELLESHDREIHRLCADLSVRELRIFGSAVTADFDPERSDVDVVADFHDPDAPGIADRYMALVDGLEAIFDRHVDVVTRPAIRNPIFRRVVERTSESLYAG